MSSHSHGNCLKTGCQLIVDGEAFWGDLFRFSEDTFVFNAVFDTNTEPAAIERLADDFCTLFADALIFERRGLFVIHALGATMNQALAKYLGEAPHA